MSKIALSTLALVTLLSACNSQPKPAAEKASEAAAIAELSVPQVAAALEGKQAVAVDANDAETRAKYGVVPGAVLLTAHRDYALTELPSDKAQQLVFYCGGTACRSSDKAASRALDAGYAKVSVMRDGIKGWAAAGKPTTGQPKS